MLECSNEMQGNKCSLRSVFFASYQFFDLNYLGEGTTKGWRG